jgi:DNA-binding IclR family transcriptional regulator
VTAAHSERALGLLVELADRGPVGIRDLLDAYDLCESDLHGLLAEFRAAGLVEERDVAGERGYDATETTREAVAALRSDS